MSEELNLDKSDWTPVTFGDVVAEVRTSTKDPIGDGIERVVGLEHIEPECIHLRNWASIEDETTFTKVFRKGHVLFGRRRAYLKKAALADFDGICSGDITVMEAKDGLMPELLPFLVNNDKFFDYAVQHSAGGLSPRTKFKDIANYEFLLPPNGQQNKLAELLFAADSQIESSKKLQAKSARLLESFVGEEVAKVVEAHEVEPLQDLIEDGRPVTYGILKPGKTVEGGIPVVKVRDYPNGKINLDNLLLTTAEIEAPYKRSRLKPGDILISIRGTIGRVTEVPPELDGANITQDTARLSIKSDVDPAYIRMILESSYVQRQIEARITGLAVQGINIGELRKIKIPVPDSRTQSDLVEKIMAARTASSIAERSIAARHEVLKSIANQIF